MGEERFAEELEESKNGVGCQDPTGALGITLLMWGALSIIFLRKVDCDVRCQSVVVSKNVN